VFFNLILLTVRRLYCTGSLAATADIEASVIFREMVTDSMMGRVDRFEIDLELPILEKVLATTATTHWQIIVEVTLMIAANSDLSFESAKNCLGSHPLE
jgi:hypothetical protein